MLNWAYEYYLCKILQKTDSKIQIWSQLKSTPQIINANAHGTQFQKKGPFA